MRCGVSELSPQTNACSSVCYVCVAFCRCNHSSLMELLARSRKPTSRSCRALQKVDDRQSGATLQRNWRDIAAPLRAPNAASREAGSRKRSKECFQKGTYALEIPIKTRIRLARMLSQKRVSRIATCMSSLCCCTESKNISHLTKKITLIELILKLHRKTLFRCEFIGCLENCPLNVDGRTKC